MTFPTLLVTQKRAPRPRAATPPASFPAFLREEKSNNANPLLLHYCFLYFYFNLLSDLRESKVPTLWNICTITISKTTDIMMTG